MDLDFDSTFFLNQNLSFFPENSSIFGDTFSWDYNFVLDDIFNNLSDNSSQSQTKETSSASNVSSCIGSVELQEVSSNTTYKEVKKVRPAALAYDQAAFSTRGSLAVLNFPEEVVRESLKDMPSKPWEEGSSPVLALKRKHTMRTKSNSKKKTKVDQREQLDFSRTSQNVLVFEDLGAEYLEQLLTLTS
ncbi:Ethylene-responsive transcription factor 15 [Glycine soja]|nr:Ethylene-responsive transcription factor 15 [Glycine soja]